MSTVSFPSTFETGKFQTRDGLNLFYRRWISGSKGTIVLVHGLGEHSGRYIHVGEFFAQAGFAVFAFDLRGHGWSDGRSAFIERHEEYLTDLDAALGCLQSPEPHFLFGHSLGGQLVLAQAQSSRKPPAGYIAASPWLDLSRPPSIWLVGVASVLNVIAPAWRFPTGIGPEEGSRDQTLLDSFPDLDKTHPFIRARTYFEVAKVGRKLLEHPTADAPVLLTHGQVDSVTSIEATRAYFEKLVAPGKAFISYPDARHELHNDLGRQKTLNDYLDWIGGIKCGTRIAERGV
jgi:alpha-beta hydrolase superfamily lysophospholipase